MFNNFKIILLLLFISLGWLWANGLIVKDVNFSGNSTFTDSELLRIVVTQPGDRFNLKTINADSERISRFYADKGLFHIKVFPAEVATSSDEFVGVTFQLEEQKEIDISNVIINGNRYISLSKIENSITLNSLKLSEIPALLQNIVELYAESGFLFSSVKLDSLILISNSYKVFVKIDEGKFCEFKDVKFRGNEVTTSQTLLKISQLRNVERITPAFLAQAEENIRKKIYIKDCRIYPINERELLVEVEEGRMNRFSGILGYDNNQKSDNRLTGFLDLEFLNLYGTDRSLALYWHKLQANSSSIELTYHESGIKDIPLSGDLSLFREEADSTYINSRIETEIYYYTLYQKYGLYYALESYFPGSRRPKIIETSTYHKVGGFWEYDDTDFAMNPRNGNFIYSKYYYIIDQENSADSDKQAIEIMMKKYWLLKKRVVLFTGVNAAYMENKNLKEYELFTLGGSKNLRGFMEKQFYGHRIAWANLEMRFLVNRNSRFFVFTDYGYVENLEYKQGKLFGLGCGLRLATRIGLLGIDYGFSYANGEWRNPMDGIIHFGLEANL